VAGQSGFLEAHCYHNRVSTLPDTLNRNRLKLPQLRTIFLDRDGVINRKMPEGQYVTSWEHFHLLPGVPEAIAKLNQAGLRVIVVTNQRGVALGLYSAADVDAIHVQFQQVLDRFGAHVDGFYFCPHDKRECICRKPLPGMFEQAQADFPGIEAATSLVIGDSLSDIEFGKNLGLPTIFIEGDPEHRKAGAEKAAALADFSATNLTEAVNLFIA
jgi:D-glycero-D-manno-heptose 1,7-bisphosphate phosphatase